MTGWLIERAESGVASHLSGSSGSQFMMNGTLSVDFTLKQAEPSFIIFLADHP